MPTTGSPALVDPGATSGLLGAAAPDAPLVGSGGNGGSESLAAPFRLCGRPACEREVDGVGRLVVLAGLADAVALGLADDVGLGLAARTVIVPLPERSPLTASTVTELVAV